MQIDQSIWIPDVTYNGVPYAKTVNDLYLVDKTINMTTPLDNSNVYAVYSGTQGYMGKICSKITVESSHVVASPVINGDVNIRLYGGQTQTEPCFYSVGGCATWNVDDEYNPLNVYPIYKLNFFGARALLPFTRKNAATPEILQYYANLVVYDISTDKFSYETKPLNYFISDADLLKNGYKMENGKITYLGGYQNYNISVSGNANVNERTSGYYTTGVAEYYNSDAGITLVYSPSLKNALYSFSGYTLDFTTGEFNFRVSYNGKSNQSPEFTNVEYQIAAATKFYGINETIYNHLPLEFDVYCGDYLIGQPEFIKQRFGAICVIRTSETTARFINIFSGEWILGEIASIGMFFFAQTGNSSDLNTPITNTNVYLGHMLPDGTTDGTWTHGQDNADGIQNNFNGFTDTPAKPVIPGPPSSEGEDEITKEKHNGGTTLPYTGLHFVSGNAFTTFYQVSTYHITQLGKILSSMPNTFWEALGTATDPKMSNILDYIVSLKWYPIQIANSSGGIYVDTPTSEIQFGFNGLSKIALDPASDNTYKLSNTDRLYNMGAVYVPYRQAVESFLDYEPYTTAKIFLPYIGTTTLPCNQVVGYTLGLYYIVDLTTGMCTAILYNDYDTILTQTGKMGVDITIAGNDVVTQSEKISSAMIRSGADVAGGVVNIATSAITGNVSGTISSSGYTVSNIANAALTVASAKRAIPESIGGGSGFGSAYTFQTPTITLQRPAIVLPGYYGHNIGYISNRTAQLNTLSGYTVCDNPDCAGIPATDSEKTMIYNLLTTGIYL